MTDAAILASSSSGTILVIDQGRTALPAIGRAKQMLDRVGAHTIGAVMNKVRASVGAYAYDYAYYASSSGKGVVDRPAGSKPDDRASSGRR